MSIASDEALVLDLEPIDVSRRPFDSSSFASTFMGKKNRAAIGRPRITVESASSADGLLETNDFKQYSPQTHLFYRLATEITLLPDRGCRFKSADLVFDFEEFAPQGLLPLVLRMSPREQSGEMTVKSSMKESGETTLKDPIMKVASVKLGESTQRTEELTRILVQIAGFGSGTREVGWRFNLTAVRDIPTTSPTLQFSVVAARGAPCRTRVRLAAEVEALGTADRWLTWAFQSSAAGALQNVIEFPVTA
jgi:hypothetical protein